MKDAERNWTELVAALDEFLTGAVSGIQTSRRVVHLRACLDQTENELFFPFVAYDSETDHLPTGELRSHYSERGLASAEMELARFEQMAKARLLRAATLLREEAQRNAI